MLIDKINGVMMDEFNFYHYAIDNFETKPVTATNESNSLNDSFQDKSTLEKTEETMSLIEHYNYLNSLNNKVKSKVLKKI